MSEPASLVPNSNQSRSSWTWCLFVFAGILTGVGSGLFADRYREHFQISQELAEEEAAVTTPNPPAELSARLREAGIRADYQNAALVVGVAAALLCGVLGALAGGLRKRGMGLALGLLLGLTLGGLSGVGGGLAGKAVEQRFAVNDMDELQRTILIHLAVWLPVGLGAGLTIGTFSGRIRSFFSIASMTTIVAAAAGAVFTIVSMFVFKTERTDRPIPDGLENVILWTTFVSTLVSFAAGRLLGASSSHEKTLRNDAGGSA